MIAAPRGFRRTPVFGEVTTRTLFSRSGPNYLSTESGELQLRIGEREPCFRNKADRTVLAKWYGERIKKKLSEAGCSQPPP